MNNSLFYSEKIIHKLVTKKFPPNSELIFCNFQWIFNNFFVGVQSQLRPFQQITRSFPSSWWNFHQFQKNFKKVKKNIWISKRVSCKICFSHLYRRKLIFCAGSLNAEPYFSFMYFSGIVSTICCHLAIQERMKRGSWRFKNKDKASNWVGQWRAGYFIAKRSVQICSFFFTAFYMKTLGGTIVLYFFIFANFYFILIYWVICLPKNFAINCYFKSCVARPWAWLPLSGVARFMIAFILDLS